MGKKKISDAPPLEPGASPTPESVPPELAGVAQAEVDQARAAPRPPAIDAEVISPPPRKRGRPKGSTNRPKGAETFNAPPEPEPEPPATPEELAELMGLFSLFCESQGVEGVPDDVALEWGKKAARVANRWGGSVPFLPELTLIVATGMIVGPRVAQLTDPEHQARVAAERQAAELRKKDEETKRQEKAAHTT